MPDDTNTRLTALTHAAALVFADALRRFSDARVPGAAELAEAYEAGEVELGLTVVLSPQPVVDCWARHTVGGPRQVLASYPLEDRRAQGALN